MQSEEQHFKAQCGRTYKSSVSYGENKIKERLQAGLQGRRGFLDLKQREREREKNSNHAALVHFYYHDTECMQLMAEAG